MSTTTNWIGRQFLVRWTLVDAVTGSPVIDATVIGQVELPDGSSAAMTLSHTAGSNDYLLSYEAADAGQHAVQLDSSGTYSDAEELTFYVERHLIGLPPIETDPSTSIGRARLFMTDLVEASSYFTDAQVQAYLDINGGNVVLAAAMGLETLAANEALVSKKIRTLDLQTDGPAVADALRALAKSLRERANDLDPETGDLFAMSVVDWNPSSWWCMP